MCERGDECRLAHSLMEVMYHREKYKTKPCERWAKPPLQCRYGRARRLRASVHVLIVWPPSLS